MSRKYFQDLKMLFHSKLFKIKRQLNENLIIIQIDKILNFFMKFVDIPAYLVIFVCSLLRICKTAYFYTISFNFSSIKSFHLFYSLFFNLSIHIMSS